MLSYPGRQVTSSCELASLRFQAILDLFQINRYINKNSGGQEKKIHYSCEGKIEKSVPRIIV